MHFLFNIKRTKVITKEMNPSTLEIWIGGKIEVDDTANPPDPLPPDYIFPKKTVIQVETETKETSNDKRSWMVNHEYHEFNPAVLQQMISGYDLATGQPTVNKEAFNQFLSQYDYELNEG